MIRLLPGCDSGMCRAPQPDYHLFFDSHRTSLLSHSVAFVHNSARLATPSNFRDNRSLDFRFNALFSYVIKDRALRDFYRSRQQEVAGDNGDDCCSGCQDGGGCEQKVGTQEFPTMYVGLATVGHYYTK